MSKHSKIADELSNLDEDVLTFLADHNWDVSEQSSSLVNAGLDLPSSLQVNAGSDTPPSIPSSFTNVAPSCVQPVIEFVSKDNSDNISNSELASSVPTSQPYYLTNSATVTEDAGQQSTEANVLSSTGCSDHPSLDTGEVFDNPHDSLPSDHQDLSVANSQPASSTVEKNVSSKLYKCKQCGKRFFRYLSAKNHCKNTQFSWACSNCGISINKKCNVRRHIDRCNRRIVKEQNKKLATESETTPKICSYCKKEAKNEKALKTHIYSNHTKGSGSYSLLCESKFTGERYLKKHMTLKHNDAPQLKCNKCDNTSHSTSGLSRHFKRVHSMSDEDDLIENSEPNNNNDWNKYVIV